MIALLALLLFAAPEAAPAATAPQAAPAKAEKVCVTKAEPGSRFKSRVCYDKAEYEQRQAEERKTIERMQRMGARSN
jgi:hypothetical protein